MNIDILIVIGSFGFTGLLVYFLLRYGSVSREWVKIEKEEIKKLKADYKRYKQSHMAGRPEGKPLYKRKMISHEGLAIYRNGIYAKFSIGKKGKYRFVLFTEISDIYPVTIENPFTKTDSTWLGLKSWKELQVETSSGMVCMIDSKKHDLERVMPMIKGAMGGRWDAIYHPDETLWSNFKEGDAYVHKSIRSQRPGYVPPRVKKEMREETHPAAGGKGALLLQESEADLERRRKSFMKGGIVLALIGAVSLVIGVIVLNTGAFLMMFFTITMLVLGIAFIFLGTFVMVASNRIVPLKIFENGFEAPLLLPGKTIFISYGEITGCATRKNFIEGEVYVYKTAVPNQMIIIKKDMVGFEKVKDHIRSRIARSEYVVTLEPTREEATRSRRIEYALYATGLILGMAVSILITANVFYGMSFIAHLYGLGLVLPPLTMFAVTFVTYSMRRMKKVVPKKLNVKIPAAIIVILLAYSLANIGLGSSIDGGNYASPEKIEPKPLSSYMTPGVYDNVTLQVDDHILVDSGQTLKVTNSILTLHLSYDKQISIWIAEGGWLILENTTIESDPLDLGYTFEIMGSARIYNSTIRGVWGDPENENDNGGLEIYSDDVIVDGSTISYTKANAILIKNSGPVIRNSTIIHVDDDGIEMSHSTALIVNNTIRDCGWAMIVAFGSEADIIGNNITNNEHGIWIGDSDPLIQNNNFTNNHKYAVNCDEYSNPTLVDNSYSANDFDVIAEEPSRALEMCLVITVGEAVFSLLILFFVYKQGLEDDKSTAF